MVLLNINILPTGIKSVARPNLVKKLAEKALRKNKSFENQINYKKSKAHFKNVLDHAKKCYRDKFCASLTRKTKLAHVWKTIKDMKGSTSKSKIIIKNSDGSLKDDSSLSESFAEIFDLEVEPFMSFIVFHTCANLVFL